MTALLAVENLSVTFDTPSGTARAVDGVSFALDVGEAVALVGESGCGKSVTAHAVLRMVAPPGRIARESAIRFGGVNLLELPADEMRRVRGARIALVLADSLGAFNPLWTIGRQMVEAQQAHTSVNRTEALRAAAAMLERTGLGDAPQMLRRYPHELSGGQRQRAALATALLLRPAILIADEPTSALDVTTQAQVLDLLNDLRAEFGTTLLLITHDLGVVRVAASRALVMYAGQIVEESPTAALLTTPVNPYTRALVGAWPRLGDARRALRPIPGVVPPATAWPAGCRFRERCASAWDVCERHAPELAPIGDGRASRCHLVTRQAP